MTYGHIAVRRHADVAAHAGPSPLRAWLRAAVARLMPGPAAAPPARDPTREAAKLRTWAACVQRTDPRFAADLFAAADRHETQGL